MDEDEEGEEPVPTRKRRKVIDSETQTTPKKEFSLLDISMEDSPLTKQLIQKAWEGEVTLRKTKEVIEIRRRSRNLLNELRTSASGENISQKMMIHISQCDQHIMYSCGNEKEV